MPTEEKLAKDNDHEDQKLLLTNTLYPTKVEVDETTQNIMGGDNSIQNSQQFLPVFTNSIPNHFNGGEEIKMKKVKIIDRNHLNYFNACFFLF